MTLLVGDFYKLAVFRLAEEHVSARERVCVRLCALFSTAQHSSVIGKIGASGGE